MNLPSLRQLAYPSEYRIPAPALPDELQPMLVQLCERLVCAQTQPAGPAESQNRLLADLGTRLWRMRHKMLPTGSDRPPEPLRAAYRDLESMWDLLAQAGLQIQDHTGTRFDSGQSLKVLAFQPTAGLTHETVIETIRPSIYLGEQHIQTGEVIVGTPDGPVAAKEAQP